VVPAARHDPDNNVIQPVSTSISGPARQRSRNGPRGMGSIEKQPISSAEITGSGPAWVWTSIVAPWAGVSWPRTDSAVISSSIVSRGWVKVSARIDAASERVAATRPRPWMES